MPFLGRNTSSVIRHAFLLLAALATACLALGACDAPTTEQRRQPESIRVACIGDSITFGLGIRDRSRDSYPSQLAAMLGNGWEVRNFGVSGATLLKKGDYPYWRMREYREALEFLPHVVIIQLGTNDTWSWNWKYRKEFARDYLALIESFEKLGTKPRIYLCSIIPAYRGKDGAADPLIRNELFPRIQGIARSKYLPVIDLYHVFEGKQDLFADPLHPNEQGARLMAETVYRAVKEAQGLAMTR